MQTEWEDIKPLVNSEAEFFEITNDFGNPLEILREAISNSVDAAATEVRIEFFFEEIDGAPTLVIQIEDNGSGMTYESLSRDFWGLGFSTSRLDKDKIGEKGHGTKIYLRSERVVVKTQTANGACESVCERPLRALARREFHSPRIRSIQRFMEQTGTVVRVEGYNQNQCSTFTQDVVRDYLRWFTKIGSVERCFGFDKFDGFRTYLKCLDKTGFEEIPFGHHFPEERPDIQALFDRYQSDAADWFVKRYLWQGRLQELPHVTYDAIVYVEGDRAKREYNPMIRDRRRQDTGKYKVADRYGIWLCRDYIPVQNVNEWITGFGTGSNSFVLLHGFVNCQWLKLTANRGSIANTDSKVMDELRKTVQSFLEEVDKNLHNNGLYTLVKWQSEERTLEQEKAEFDRRSKAVSKKKMAKIGNTVLLEPKNEAELFGLFMVVYGLKPDVFDFEPLDYSTSRGIDIVARNKAQATVAEGKYWYVEMKYLLRDEFNHAFKNLRWIVCWDFDKNITTDSDFHSIEETDVRDLEIRKDDGGRTIYFLNPRTTAVKIQVIRLRQFLEERLGLVFTSEPAS